MFRYRLLTGVVFVTLITLGSVLPSAPTQAKTDWWKDFNRRAKVTVTETSGVPLTDFQVKVVVPYDSDMQPDFDDIRFIDPGSETELLFWREGFTAGEYSTFWVRIPSLPASGTTDIYMYYGDRKVSSTSNIHSTFIWGDDFEDPAWTSASLSQVNYGACRQYILNGEYHMEGAPASEPIAEITQEGSLKSFPDSYVAEVGLKPVVKGGGGGFINPRYQSVADKYECLIDTQWNNTMLNKVVSNVWTNLDTVPLGYEVQAGVWYSLRADVARSDSGDRLRVYVNDALYIDRNDPDLAFPGLAFLSYDWDDSFHLAYDNFRVRKLAAEEPLISIGREEPPKNGIKDEEKEEEKSEKREGKGDGDGD